jgi:glycosyltransferase involved in cell wall biosynthesis
MRKKLLFIINTMGRAGAETALIALLKKLDSMNEYDLSHYSIIPCGEMFDQLPAGVHILNKRIHRHSLHSLPGRIQIMNAIVRAFFYRFNGFQMLGYLARNLKEQKSSGKRLQYDKLLWRLLANGLPRQRDTYDLAISYIEGASAYYLADKVSAVSKAAFIHIDYESSGYTPLMDQDCYRSMDRIFVVSNEVGTKFLRVYPELRDKVSLFRNLLDRERILMLANRGSGFTDDYSGIRLVTVGRLHYQKGYDIAIEALSILRKEGFPVRWYVIGEGTERANLEQLIKKHGIEDSFLLLGAKDNPYPYIKQADLYVQATRYEGKSIAVEEAQILGKAILASDCTGNSEQIISGYDGLLIPLSTENLVSALKTLINDPSLRSLYAEHVLEKKLDYPEDLDQLLALLRKESYNNHE